MSHNAGVGERGVSVYGHCTCGWVGELRPHVGLANQDVLHHVMAGHNVEALPSRYTATLDAPPTEEPDGR